ncbi:AAA family ATPase [Thermococcus sp. 21S7]|uniref:McrB family protein n=1 Tax=Thermococcus sp. 21S7 TaxID=1638221 RepID=UPI001F0D41C7|nr:AAA family ATPase [Thermococcus sp. 21S7]
MSFTKEDAENLLEEVRREFLGKVKEESFKQTKIRYFDDHRIVEIKFDLWRRYMNGKEYGISYMWTVYLRTQKIRYGLAVSCSSTDASERVLTELLGKDAIESLEDKGFSIIRFDRRVMLGRELPLDAFDETQKEESVRLMASVHALIGDSIATLRGALCFNTTDDPLVVALRDMKARYWEEWKNNGEPLIQKARENVIRFAKGESQELNIPSDISGDAGRLLWFVAGGVSDRGDPEGIREFLRALMEASPADALGLVHEYSRKIKGTSILGIINLAALVYPEELMPLWGSDKETRGILNPTSSKLLGLKKKASKLKLDEYENLRDRIKYAAEEIGASNLFEVAFYLMRMSKNKLQTVSYKEKHILQTYLLNDYLSLRGYRYPQHLVSQFYTALKTKGFVILSGLTGTGKTKIVQELARLLDYSKRNFLFLSVRPDWRDSKPLLGYYNPLTGGYHKTSLLKFIMKAIKDYEDNRGNATPYFVILDEMNLAHVEYYFADFLSVLESGRDGSGFTREGIKLHDSEEIEVFEGIPWELKLPPNLYIIGTVNMDETTYSFSPKVLDRAFTVEFHDVELEGYPPGSGESRLPNEAVEALRDSILEDLRGKSGQFLARSKEGINEAVKELRDAKNGEYWRILTELNKALEPYDMHFGYRVVDEIALFVQSAKESWENGIVEFESDDEIFDLALLMKVLPKFHGNRKKLEEPLKAVLGLCLSENAGIDVRELRREEVMNLLKNWETQRENFRFKHTAKKALRMLRQLYEIGFASFS